MIIDLSRFEKGLVAFNANSIFKIYFEEHENGAPLLKIIFNNNDEQNYIFEDEGDRKYFYNCILEKANDR